MNVCPPNKEKRWRWLTYLLINYFSQMMSAVLCCCLLMMLLDVCLLCSHFSFQNSRCWIFLFPRALPLTKCVFSSVSTARSGRTQVLHRSSELPTMALVGNTSLSVSVTKNCFLYRREHNLALTSLTCSFFLYLRLLFLHDRIMTIDVIVTRQRIYKFTEPP